MKKWNWKSYAVGIISGLLMFGGTTVFAESVQKTINVLFDDVKLVVNGTPANKPTILYDGTTYVPLRDTAEILGQEVSWDGNTRTAYVDKQGTNRQIGTTTATPAPTEESIATPVPTATPEPAPSSATSFRNSSEVKKYLEDTYKSFSYTSTSTDGLDTKTTTYTVKIERASVTWSSPDKISISIYCNSSLLSMSTNKSGYEAAKIYMKKIADDIIPKLTGVEITSVDFYYGWYTYPTIQVDYNSRSYCRWKTVNGVFVWSPTTYDKYAES